MGKPSTPFIPVPSTESLGRKQAARNGESLGRQLDFYTIRTTLDITPGVYGSVSQNRLNALIEVIGTRAQPIIVSVEASSIETAPQDLTAAGTNTVSVFELKFALEHFGAWDGATPTLGSSLNGILDFVTTAVKVTPGVADNIAVTRFVAL